MKPFHAKIVRFLSLMFVLCIGCNTDLYTKRIAEKNLKDKPSISVVEGFVNLRYTQNENAGFSLFNQVSEHVRKPLLIGLNLVASFAVCVFVFLNRNRSFGFLLPFFLILSGAFGNLIDRLMWGHVVDFIHFHIRQSFSWPIFNVADILITVGLGMVIINSLIKHDPKPTSI